MTNLLALAAVEIPGMAAAAYGTRSYLREGSKNASLQHPQNAHDRLLQRKQFGMFLEHNPEDDDVSK